MERGQAGGRFRVETDDVATYEPPEPTEKMVAINVRVPQSTKDSLTAIVKLWGLYAKARGDDAKVIDLSYVIRRAFKVFADQTFAEFNGRPTTDADWAKVEQAIAKAVSKKR